MKNVMTRAWEIAREGQKKFGGKVKEYFAQALVMAWEEIKKGVNKMEDLQAVILERGLKLYNDYIQMVVSNGGKVLSQNDTEYTIENMGKKHVVSFKMSDLDVFAKVTRGKQVKYFNIGRVE